MRRAVLAKYPGRCASCLEPIQPGDRIASVGDSNAWVHDGCGLEVALSGLTPESAPARAIRGRPAEKPRTARAHMAAPTGAISVYTDGACSGNPGPGGWAWAIDREHYASGSEKPSTNQRMEIRAALEAVTALRGPLVVVSDSTYVVNCFRDRWWAGWMERGWLNSQKKPVANRDLWEPLVDAVNERGDVAFQWVKGHSGHEMNDLVDQLAVAASLAVD